MNFKMRFYLIATLGYAVAFVFLFSSLVIELLVNHNDWSKDTSLIIGILSSLFLFASMVFKDKYLEAQEEYEDEQATV